MLRRHLIKSFTALGAGLLVDPATMLAASPFEEAAASGQVRRVLVMFKCHFDAGFIDTQANVVHKYFAEYFPHAIETAAAMRSQGDQRYLWTTGSWLLYEYLEQASSADRKRMEEAIGRGDIAWHALPFTWQTEMLDPSMIDGALALSRTLDKRFGRVTTGAKMTDVPGHTRGLIKPLAEHGVTFLDIGVNDASTPATLPPMFLWKDKPDSSGASLPVMYHAGYGAVTVVPGSDVAIAIVVRGDNSGPHSISEIAKIYSDLEMQFPGAKIMAANLSEIAAAVSPFRGNLPVVTEEIGDSWIHGVGSDPLKVSRYREVVRLRQSWIQQGKLRVGDEADLTFLRHALLEVEHTWGTDTKTWLDFTNYKPDDLERVLATKNYKVVEFSWTEKRQDLLEGITALPEPLRVEAMAAVDRLKAVMPTLTSKAKSLSAGTLVETAHHVIGIDEQTGAICRLRNKATGREWASRANPIGLFVYQTLAQADYDEFFKDYLKSTADWAYKDFGKPNIAKIGAERRDWLPTMTSVGIEENAEGHRIVVELRIEGATAAEAQRISPPAKIYLELVLPKKDPSIQMNLTWTQKRQNRMPEALWLTFNPIAQDSHGWTLEKTGQSISPFEVVSGGNRRLHAVMSGFSYSDAKGSFAVDTVDAPLVALGDRSSLIFKKTQPDLSRGVHSNLFNNSWGTNYLMWFGEDMRFRYVLRV